MRKILKLVTVWIALLVLVAGCDSGGHESVDLPQTLANQTARINYPEGWVGDSIANAMRFANDDAVLSFLPDNISAGQVSVYVTIIQHIMSNIPAGTSLEDELLTRLATDSPVLDDVELFNEDDNPAVIVKGTIALGGRTFGIIYALIHEDSTSGYLSLIAPEDEIDDYVDTVRSMIVTFDAEPPLVDG